MAHQPPSRASVGEQLAERARQRDEFVQRGYVRAFANQPTSVTEDIAIAELRNRLLHMRALQDKRDPETPGKDDDRVWRDPGKAIHWNSASQFNRVFREWVRDVNDEVKRYERKLMVDAYVKDGTRLGIWSNELGVKLAHYFPETFGQNITSPPPYFEIWTPREREVADTYLTYLELGRLRPFSLGLAAGTLATPFLYTYAKYVMRLPRFPSILLMPYASLVGGLFIGLLCVPFLRPLHNRKKAMHNLMFSRDSFVAAKARRYYDDMMWPSNSQFHNRHYLKYVPRDKFDEFVWSIDDSAVRNGDFDRDEWAFVQRTSGQLTRDLFVARETMAWPERRDRYIKEAFQFFGWGFWWDKNGSDVLKRAAGVDERARSWLSYLRSKLPATENTKDNDKQNAR